MTYYLYFSHTGNYFIMKEELSEEELFCEMCSDYDELIGEFTSKAELIQLLLIEDITYDEVIDEVVDSWERIFNDGKSN